MPLKGKGEDFKEGELKGYIFRRYRGTSPYIFICCNYVGEGLLLGDGTIRCWSFV